jgi:hypothetical protein
LWSKEVPEYPSPSWLSETGSGADPRPVFFAINDPKAPNKEPVLVAPPAIGGPKNALSADELPEY